MPVNRPSIRPERVQAGAASAFAPRLLVRAADDNRAAGRLDRLDRGLRRAGHLDRDRRRQFALGEQANAVAGPPQYAGRRQASAAVTGACGAEASGIDRLLQTPEIDDLVVLPEDLVVEAALRQPAMQRRLAALEAVDRDAAARGLALAAAPRCLALARADAAPDPLCPVMRARIVPDLVELHHCPSDRGPGPLAADTAAFLMLPRPPARGG